jgi:hypothetical protein
MDAKSQAELEIISAAQFWIAEVMRCDRYLNVTEQALFDAVLHYNSLTKQSIKLPPPSKPVFPKPPKLPSDLVRSLTPRDSEIDTIRYSEKPTDRAKSSYGLKDTIVYDIEG